MNFLNIFINKLRELKNYQTVIVNDNDEECDIIKAKINSLFGELQFIDNEILEIKKIIDNE